MSARPAMALGADALTSSRALFGPVLAALIGVGRLSAAALVLGVAWLSDALDGRLARASGSIPLPVAALVLVGLGSAFLALRNPALGMAVQAIGYGAFLWRLWAERVAAGWVPGFRNDEASSRGADRFGRYAARPAGSRVMPPARLYAS